ncbi:MAG TPA: 2-C-methyl-D-erythritol 4-phosphate cytidylyltransferase, partial [Thermoanaerobaculia bacterium]|nr:2-C-methyl-D-erythritol 4-phosphate cytidylyltransferase [Thermoanaerobaculia bacterium]
MLPPTLVIIPAAGSGTRLGGDLPKQYRQLAGRTILDHVIERFLREPAVAKLIVCVAADRLDAMQRTMHYEKV